MDIESPVRRLVGWGLGPSGMLRREDAETRMGVRKIMRDARLQLRIIKEGRNTATDNGDPGVRGRITATQKYT